MQNTIVNFFKFLEEKIGTKTPIELKLLNQDLFTFLKNEKILVNRSLYLKKSNIEKLPDNLTINGSLELDYSEIIELPNNLTVNYSLSLQHTKIIKLPVKLIICRNLDIRNTHITQLPMDINVDEYVLVDKDKLEWFEKQYPDLLFYH